MKFTENLIQVNKEEELKSIIEKIFDVANITPSFFKKIFVELIHVM